MVILLFREAQRRILSDGHTHIFVVMEYTVVKYVFTRDADEIFDDKMYKLAES